MTKMRSKLKQLMNPRLREYLAAICDTREIQNNQEKMDLVQRFLNRYNLKAEPLGGATNRYVTMVDGYAIKFAVDEQGYKDNLMEFCLSTEVPWTTKSYEVNGYMLVQQCIRRITDEEWRLRKPEILKILDAIGQEYLLGDVGYYDVNKTNWGVDDDGNLLILDYAYCHRLTENLFTCPYCGSLLKYDSNFVYVLCTDRANCHAKFSYNDIKQRQGDKVDWDMIREKLGNSIKLPAGVTEITTGTSNKIATGNNMVVINNYRDLELKRRYDSMVSIKYAQPEVITILQDLMIARAEDSKEEVNKLEGELDKYKEDKPDINFIVSPEFQEELDAHNNDSDESDDNEPSNKAFSLDDLISMAGDADDGVPIDDSDDNYSGNDDTEDDTMYSSLSPTVGFSQVNDEDNSGEMEFDVEPTIGIGENPSEADIVNMVPLNDETEPNKGKVITKEELGNMSDELTKVMDMGVSEVVDAQPATGDSDNEDYDADEECNPDEEADAEVPNFEKEKRDKASPFVSVVRTYNIGSHKNDDNTVVINGETFVGGV